MTHTTSTQRYKLDYPVRGELTDIDRKILAEIEQELNTMSYERLPEADVRYGYTTLSAGGQANYEEGQPNTEGGRAFFQLMLDYAAPTDIRRPLLQKFDAAQVAASRERRRAAGLVP